MSSRLMKGVSKRLAAHLRCAYADHQSGQQLACAGRAGLSSRAAPAAATETTHAEQPSTSHPQKQAQGRETTGPDDQSGPSLGEAAEQAQAFVGGFASSAKSGFEDVRSRLSSTGAAGRAAEASRGASSLWATLQSEVKQALMPQEEYVSALRSRHNIAAAPAEADPDAPTDITIVKKDRSRMEDGFEALKQQFGSHPIFQQLSKLRRHEYVQRAEDAAAGVRERLETTDHPLVHRVWDMQDRLFAENEMARALREIRTRDPFFDMPKFLKTIKQDVPVVTRAHLEGDRAVIEDFCNASLTERLTGIAAAQQALGHSTDSTILQNSEVELVDVKVHPDTQQPVVIVQFTCQQINCVRDAFGNVVEGKPDEVQRVYYMWALEQEEAGTVTKDGKILPPRWLLVEMMVRGMHHLL